MSNDERRDYFRINDHLGVSWRVLADEDLETGELPQPPDVYSLLSGYDELIDKLVGELKGREPRLIELVSCLNKKINCVINQLEMESRLIEQIAHKIYDVNLSACGMAMCIDECLPAGTRIELDLVLLPESRRLLAQAQVVSCDPLTEGFYLRMKFRDMSSQTQEQLIQHIVKRQGDLLRDSRERLEQGTGEGAGDADK